MSGRYDASDSEVQSYLEALSTISNDYGEALSVDNGGTLQQCPVLKRDIDSSKVCVRQLDTSHRHTTLLVFKDYDQNQISPGFW